VRDDSIVREILTVAHEIVGGLFEPPPKMVDSITAWVVGTLAYRMETRLRLRLDDYEEHKDWSGVNFSRPRTVPGFVSVGDIDELEKVGVEGLKKRLRADIARMKKYISASPIKPRFVDKKWQRAFKIDLSGWKYLSRVKKADPENLKRAKHIYPSVKAEIDMRDNDSTTSAEWYIVQRRLVVHVDIYVEGSGLVEHPGETIRGLRRTIAHELRHFSQDYLRIIVGSHDKAGLPSRKHRTPDVEQSLGKNRKYVPPKVQKTIDRLESQGITSDIFHDLDDVEFYTELVGAIEEISDNLPYFKDNRKGALLSMVGAGEKLRGAYPLKFMLSLKQHAPGKWKKAVKEIVRALL